MPTPDEDFAQLLDSSNAVEIDLARNLLEAAGIPSLTTGPDFDIAELGVASHMASRGASLYVTRDRLDEARGVLREAWGHAGVDALSVNGEGDNSAEGG